MNPNKPDADKAAELDQWINDEFDQSVKRGGKQYAEAYCDGLNDGYNRAQSSQSGKERAALEKAAWGKGWDSAITLANNICVSVSDDCNNNDEIEKADAANDCAKQIRKYLEDRSYFPEGLSTDVGERDELDKLKAWKALESYMMVRDDLTDDEFEDYEKLRKSYLSLTRK